MVPRIFMHVPHDEPDEPERLPIPAAAVVFLVLSAALWSLLFVIGALIAGVVL